MQTITRITTLLLSLCLALLALGLVWGFLASAQQPPHAVAQASAGHEDAFPAQAVATLDRDWEPVIVTGTFSGAPVNEIFVYRAVGGGWEQIPFQVDELTASGSYTLTEDGQLDANDEIVFMAGDLGDEATTSITTSLPISIPWYQIEVTDPLNPAKKGWAYLVRSSQLTLTAADYVDYITASQRISATNYALGWATSHAGLDYMTLFDSADILDRTKLRVLGSVLGIPVLITEESPLLPPPEIVLIREGLVRVIARRGAATTLAYASKVETVTPLELLPPFTVTTARISTDLNSNATGGTFYNENTPPEGVIIDGITDTIAITTPLVNAWRQISLDSGTIVQVMDIGSPGGVPYHYYKDNNTFDRRDTGDGMSYGDAGIYVANPTTTVVTLTSAQYILSGRQDNRGAEFYEFFRNPLLVSLRLEGGKMVYLPLVMK